MSTGVVVAQDAVWRRLGEIGLDVEVLHAALQAGVADRYACTDNDPKTFPGLLTWGRTLRRLRELLIPRGWRKSDALGLPCVMNAAKTVAIAVSTGDEFTGSEECEPHSYPKGPAWEAAVERNAKQLSFPFPTHLADEKRRAGVHVNRVTWVLLLHVKADEVRCELSMPKYLGDDATLAGWVERIILPPMQLDPDPMEIEEPVPTPTIDVPVVRRR